MPRMMRRRPIRRVATMAVVGGGAYALGRSGGKSSAQDEQRKTDVEAEAAEAKRLAEEAKATAAATAAPAEGNIAEIEKLAKLKEQGIITNEEFTAKKKQLLGI